MPEEFIEDIIGSDVVPKTETEIAAEIQGDKSPDKSAEKQVDKTLKTDESLDLVEGAPQASSTPKDAKKVTTDSVDPIKELATQLGWREDHQGEDAVDAKTYILKSKDIQKSMSQHNKDLKDQLQTLNGSVSALKAHNESVYKAEVKKLEGEVAKLKKERKAAIELADVDRVEELDKQIDDKQKDINAPKPAAEQVNKSTANPDYDAWIVNNQWYLKDDDMAKFAETVASQYAGAPLDRVYALVRNKVQEVFPDKFEPVKAADVVKSPVGPKSPVERSSAKGNSATFTKADLTPDQVQIMNQFVRGGIMTEEAYINDIAKMQE